MSLFSVLWWTVFGSSIIANIALLWILIWVIIKFLKSEKHIQQDNAPSLDTCVRSYQEMINGYHISSLELARSVRKDLTLSTDEIKNNPELEDYADKVRAVILCSEISIFETVCGDYLSGLIPQDLFIKNWKSELITVLNADMWEEYLKANFNSNILDAGNKLVRDTGIDAEELKPYSINKMLGGDDK